MLDLLAIEGDAFVEDYLAGASCTAPLDAAGVCLPPSDVLADQTVSLGGPDWQERTAPSESVSHDDPILPAGMVGVVRGISGFGLELPDDLRHRVRLRARDGARVVLDTTVSAAALSGLESMIWYRPATPDDEDLVATYGDLWLTPPYLVNVVPELKVDGESLAVGTEALGMGQPFELEVTLRLPSGNELFVSNSQLTGVPVGLGLAPGIHGYVPPEGGPANTPEVLTWLVGNYLDASADFASRLARVEGLVEVHPYPSLAIVASVVEPIGLFGLVEELEWLGIYVDADVFGSRAVGAADDVRRWLELVQLESSAQERILFENLGNEAVSADQLMVWAQSLGVVVETVDLSNVDSVVSSLPYSDEVRAEIDGWVRAGGEALVPLQPLDFIEFSGVGYVLRDPATGEARYQLAGGLSGGMIAVPPMEISSEVASPLQFPRDAEVVTDGSLAISLQIFDGNHQIAEVDELLGDDAGRPLRVLVKDERGRLVSNAEVTFRVRAGGGTFGGASSTTVRSQGGFAETTLKLSTQTDDNPYFLEFPSDDYPQRTDLTIVSATVNGYPMYDLFYSFARPGDVTDLQTPLGLDFAGLPHLMMEQPLAVVPVDRFENPVASTRVRFELSGGTPDEGEGPELVTRQSLADCGQEYAVAGECAASQSVTEMGPLTGVFVFMVVGDDEDRVVATASEDGASGSVTFTVRPEIEDIPTGEEVGRPALLLGRRVQPVNTEYQSLEAYAPGNETHPLRVELFVVSEDFTVEPCGEDQFCTVPEGTYSTRRLGTDGAPTCSGSGDQCSQGTEEESADVVFLGIGESVTITDPIPAKEGAYEHVVTMPETPGHYFVSVVPTTVRVLVPERPPGGAPHHVVP